VVAWVCLVVWFDDRIVVAACNNLAHIGTIMYTFVARAWHWECSDLAKAWYHGAAPRYATWAGSPVVLVYEDRVPRRDSLGTGLS